MPNNIAGKEVFNQENVWRTQVLPRPL